MQKKKKVAIIIISIVVLLLIAVKVLIGNPIETLKNWNKPMSIPLPKVEVKLPNQLISVGFDSTTVVNNLKIDRTTLLVCIDSVHCMPCKVDMLHNYEEMDRILKNSISDSIQTMAVLSPKESELEALIYKLKREQLKFPVYIDSNNEFLNLNPFFMSFNETGEFTICTDKEGIYGLCHVVGPCNISSVSLFEHVMSILHKFNYYGVELEYSRIRNNY